MFFYYYYCCDFSVNKSVARCLLERRKYDGAKSSASKFGPMLGELLSFAEEVMTTFCSNHFGACLRLSRKGARKINHIFARLRSKLF